MKEPIIVFARGVWTHPDTVNWLIEQIKEATGLEVIDFNYSDEIAQNISDKTYLNRVTEQYGDEIITKNIDIIYFGHSHGAALGIVFNKMYGSKKLVFSAPAIRPFGYIRKLSNRLNKNYVQHLVVKYPREPEIRKEYFYERFDLWRDFNRVFYVGTQAKKSIDAIKSDTLLVQGTKDEFVNVGTNIRLFNKINLPEYKPGETTSPNKQLIVIPGGEHSIFEEVLNKGKDNEELVYKKLFNELEKFTKR